MQITGQTQILLVEDDDTARLSLTSVLGRAGYSVEAVPDGEQAIELLAHPIHSLRFDVVLTDLLLREADGIQVLRNARELPDPPEVILLTGYGTLQTAIESLRSGAFDYLLKPCKPDDLLRCVESAAQRRHARRAQNTAVKIIAQGLAHLQSEGSLPGALAHAVGLQEPGSGVEETDRIGQLTINRRARSVAFAGKPLALTPTEYALLCCLADAHGQMLTYSEIARCVYRQAVDDATAHQLLKTHIHNLRYKLDPAYIVNVRSTGYRLVAPPAQ